LREDFQIARRSLEEGTLAGREIQWLQRFFYFAIFFHAPNATGKNPLAILAATRKALDLSRLGVNPAKEYGGANTPF